MTCHLISNYEFYDWLGIAWGSKMGTLRLEKGLDLVLHVGSSFWLYIYPYDHDPGVLGHDNILKPLSWSGVRFECEWRCCVPGLPSERIPEYVFHRQSFCSPQKRSPRTIGPAHGSSMRR